MTDLTERLDRNDQLAAEATDGPWVAEFSGEQGNCVIPHDAESTREAVAVTRLYDQHADAAFIAHARSELPALNRALRAALEIKMDLAEMTRDPWDHGYLTALRQVRRAITDAMGEEL